MNLFLKLFQTPEIHIEATFQKVRVWNSIQEFSCGSFVLVLTPPGKSEERICAVGIEIPSNVTIDAKK